MLDALRTSLGRIDLKLDNVLNDIDFRTLEVDELSEEADILIELKEKAEELKDLITRWQEHHKFI